MDLFKGNDITQYNQRRKMPEKQESARLFVEGSNILYGVAFACKATFEVTLAFRRGQQRRFVLLKKDEKNGAEKLQFVVFHVC